MLDEIMAASQTFNLVPHVTALAVAYVLALPIGWDRESEERSAGIRTFPLVAIASCGFIQAAETITHNSPEATARIVEGIITGMGFVGGGAILRLKRTWYAAPLLPPAFGPPAQLARLSVWVPMTSLFCYRW